MTPAPHAVPELWRILVTDDEPKSLTGVVETLRGAGHCVFAAYSGEAAFELCLTLRDLDLLITNTRIDLVSCGDLIRLVREQQPSLPILHLGAPLPSGGASCDVRSLSPPFSPQELLTAVTAAVLGV
jgi:DNA-binding response OmpR family regulator